MTQEAFKAWWYNEGSQAPYTHHDCEEHTMRMCEIAWNKAQALAQPEQKPVAWLDGPHLVVRSDMRDRLNYKGPWVDLGRAIPDKWTPLLFTTPPQRKPLTYCQECMRPNPIDGTDCAHGIKEST